MGGRDGRMTESADARMSEAVRSFALSGDPVLARLEAQLGWIGQQARSAPKRALFLVALAWGVPLVLSASAGDLWGPASARPFLLDWGSYARFLVAIFMLVWMERLVDRRLRLHLRQFVEAPLLAPSAMAPAAAAVTRSIDRAQSPVALVVCVLVAVVVSVTSYVGLVGQEVDSWLVEGTPEAPRLTAAAYWCLVVSKPLFWVLLLRWLWRHTAWALLLRDLARLELRLVVTHPDGVGGLAFIGQYPNAFAALVLAMSMVLAASIAHAFQQDALSLQVYSYVMGGWLALVFALFAVPLAAFAAPLRELKEKTLLAASSQATRHFRAVERATLGRNLAAGDDASSETKDDVANPQPLYAAALKMGTIPFSRTAILPLGAAALLPLVGAGATRLPFADLWKVAKRLLLL